MTALNRSRLQHLLNVTAGSRWHVLWILLGTTRLRLGEALGIKWDDVDLAEGRLVVGVCCSGTLVGVSFCPAKNGKEPADHTPIRGGPAKFASSLAK
jgi:integrase